MNILICGGDKPVLQRLAQELDEPGMTVQTSDHIIDDLVFSEQAWNVLLIDLEGLDSFLRKLIPTIRLEFPNLPMVGLSIKSGLADRGDLKLDAYLDRLPQADDLISLFPQLAAE